MELRYHSCGHPIRIWQTCRRSDGSPTFFDGSQSWAERAILSCPRCGARLSVQTLHEQPRVAGQTIHSWLQTWPRVEHELRQRLDQQERHDLAEQAMAAVDEFDWALRQLAAIVAGLEQTAAPHALDVARDEPLLVPA